ncbi:hypothetical protein, partial [Stutzerimonas nitrititolerans]
LHQTPDPRKKVGGLSLRGGNPKHAMHGFSAQGCWRAAPAIPKCRRSAQKIYLASLGSCIESASEE